MFSNLKRVLAVAMLSTTLGGIAIPSIVSAQSTPNQDNSTYTQKHREGGWKKLNLSDAQKQQLKSIRESTKQQVQGILTDDQRAKLAAAKQSGNHKGVWKSLNITSEQKQQIRDLRKSAKDQALAVLTPEQRTQLQQMRAAHQRK
jgi:protein CpxP